MTLKKSIAIVLLLCSNLVQSQVARLSGTEIEKRNAAVAFALGREGSLYTLLGECSHLMSLSNLTIEARFDRNKPELEAAYVWLDQYLLHLKANDPSDFQLASTELARVQGKVNSPKFASLLQARGAQLRN